MRLQPATCVCFLVSSQLTLQFQIFSNIFKVIWNASMRTQILCPPLMVRATPLRVTPRLSQSHLVPLTYVYSNARLRTRCNRVVSSVQIFRLCCLHVALFVEDLSLHCLGSPISFRCRVSGGAYVGNGCFVDRKILHLWPPTFVLMLRIW